MSQRSRSVAAALFAAGCTLAACSGSNNESLNSLETGRRDAGRDSAPPSDEVEEPDAATTDVDADTLDAEGPQTTPDAASVPDAGPKPELDASAPDAAMDGSTSAVPDGASDAGEGGVTDPDGGSDAQALVPDAAQRTLRLTLTRAGAPIPRAYVVFYGVDELVGIEERVIGVGETNAVGVVESTLQVRALTVVIPQPSDATDLHIFTYYGLQTGDDLALEVPVETDTQTSYALSLTPFPNATHYEAGGGPGACMRGATSANETALTVTNPEGCLAPTGNAVLVSAWTAPSDVPLLAGYALASGLAGPSPGAAPVPVQVGAFGGYQDVHLVGKNVPADLSVTVGLKALLGAQRLPLSPKSGRPDMTSQMDDVEFGAPQFAFDAFIASADLYPSNMQHRLLLRTATSSTGSDLDFDLGNALPAINDFLVETDSNGATRAYWTSDSSDARDAYMFEVTLRSREAGSRPVTWAALVPPGLRRVRLPPVPPELAASIPSSASHYWQVERISAVASSRITDYAAFRNQKLLYLDSRASHLTEIDLDAAGHAELATFGYLP